MSVMTREPVSSWTSQFRVATSCQRVGDLLIASGLIIVALPLMVAVAVSIKCSSRGPVFSRYRRIGPDGHAITVLQFRIVAQRAPHADACICWEQPLTRVGQLLCSTRLNALPQLVNVMHGDMTLIGNERERPDFLSCRY